MDIIENTRELGKNIQQSELYIKMQMLEQACEEDEEIQNLIGELNLKRMAVHNEAQKEDRSDEKITALTAEHQALLEALLANEKMKAYNEAKDQLEGMMKRISGILTQCADGNDPDDCDYDDAGSSCGSGGCANCSGCR